MFFGSQKNLFSDSILIPANNHAHNAVRPFSDKKLHYIILQSVKGIVNKATELTEFVKCLPLQFLKLQSLAFVKVIYFYSPTPVFPYKRQKILTSTCYCLHLKDINNKQREANKREFSEWVILKIHQPKLILFQSPKILKVRSYSSQAIYINWITDLHLMLRFYRVIH